MGADRKAPRRNLLFPAEGQERGSPYQQWPSGEPALKPSPECDGIAPTPALAGVREDWVGSQDPLPCPHTSWFSSITGAFLLPGMRPGAEDMMVERVAMALLSEEHQHPRGLQHWGNVCEGRT